MLPRVRALIPMEDYAPVSHQRWRRGKRLIGHGSRCGLTACWNSSPRGEIRPLKDCPIWSARSTNTSYVSASNCTEPIKLTNLMVRVTSAQMISELSTKLSTDFSETDPLLAVTCLNELMIASLPLLD